MAYIYLDELKEILPDIMQDWIDKDDESWEYIFQAIEQKCHVGKKKKDKKKQKKKVEEVVDILKENICDLNDFHRELNKKVDELSKKVSKQSDNYTVITSTLMSKVNRMEQDVTAAKSMAQTAKQRTDVDYMKCSKEKSDAEDVMAKVYDRMAGRGATREELDTFRNLIQKYDALEKKEIPVVKKACETCKYNGLVFYNKQPCNSCNNYDNWKAKDNG